MKLKIDFDELCYAFEQSDVNRHYFIDTKKHKLIYINEEVETDTSEKLEKMENDRHIPIPQRWPEDNFEMMEMFIYDLGEKDFELAEKFHRVLDERKPFRNFKRLLEQHLELREKWFKFKDEQIRNEAINWLCENQIELENQQLIPSVEIKELTKDELEALPKDFKDFGPMACLNCKNKEGLKSRLFSINVRIENVLVEKEIKRIMKEKYGIDKYGVSGDEQRELLTVSECPKCGSEDAFWDY